MTRDATVLVTLTAYNLILLAMGVWASRRNHDTEDFLLAGRRMGGWVAGLSASASSSSSWTLLGVSGAAYAWGLPAMWLLPATLGGFLLNWLWVAPRLQHLARREGALTLPTIVLPASLGVARVPLLRLAAAIILFCFVCYIAAQFDAAAKAFNANFGWSVEGSLLLGAAIVMTYTAVGGFWAVSVTDALQALLMVGVAVVLPLLVVVAGTDSAGTPPPVEMDPGAWPAWIGFVLGTLGIGLGYPGQPHVVNRFMALEDRAALQRGRGVALIWALLVYSGMLTLGLAARSLALDVGDNEQVLFAAANAVLPPVLSGLVLAAVLAAVMSTADSQLLTAAGAVSHDWSPTAGGDGAPRATRYVVMAIAVLAVLLALYLPQDVFSRVLFAWHAVGSALGPLLIARLLARRPGAWRSAASMLLGFCLTVLLHFLPGTPGDWAERLLPLAAAAIVLLGSPREPAR